MKQIIFNKTKNYVEIKSSEALSFGAIKRMTIIFDKLNFTYLINNDRILLNEEDYNFIRRLIIFKGNKVYFKTLMECLEDYLFLIEFEKEINIQRGVING